MNGQSNLTMKRATRISAVATLCILFAWVYGSAIPHLHFVMDDFINATSEIRGPLDTLLMKALDGSISWSGYRPLTIIMRILMVRAFGLEQMMGYYIIVVGLHLLNTLLAYSLIERISRSILWSFVAAAVVLLLPSHNEAVFWFGANASPLALFFSLIMLHFAVTYRARASVWAAVGCVVTYALAVLSFEVVIVLPFFIFLADWALDGSFPRDRKKWALYIALGIAAFLLLLIRLLTKEGALTPTREDYMFTLDIPGLLQGYSLLAGQMLLLHTSPWIGAPLYQNVREWMPLTETSAIVSIILAIVLSSVVIYLHLRSKRADVGANGQSEVDQKRNGLASRGWKWLVFWFGWGFLWVVLIGLPFAGLSGRNPENRYTYILAFGMSVMIAAFGAALERLTRANKIARFALLSLVVTGIAGYAYVSTSDASEWMRAGEHVWEVQEGLDDHLDGELADGTTVFATGIPYKVGAAYVFELEGAFQSAIDLHYGWRPERPILGDLSLRQRILAAAPEEPALNAFIYEENKRRVHQVEQMLLCENAEECDRIPLEVPADDPRTDPMIYMQLYDTDQPELGGMVWMGFLEREEQYDCYPFWDPAFGPLAESAHEHYPERCALLFELAYQANGE